MVRSPLVPANPITLPQCPLCTAEPGGVKWYLVGVAPRQASVGCICGYFSWMYLWGTNTAWAAFLPQLDWEWTVWTCWSAFSFKKFWMYDTIVKRSMMMRGGREEDARKCKAAASYSNLSLSLSHKHCQAICCEPRFLPPRPLCNKSNS